MDEKEKIILPEKYYLEYFQYMLDFVERQYSHVLDLPEYEFYQAFRDLSEDAQCLYLRFSNRRGDFFRISKISYPEISDISTAKKELEQHEFIRINENTNLAQIRLFTKKELSEYFDFLDVKQRKEEMYEELSESDVEILHQQEEIVEVLKNEEVEFLKLLFFGNRQGGITDFVIRDIGNVKIEQLNTDHFEPWFQSREEAVAVMHLYQLRSIIKEIIASELPLEDYLEELPWEGWLSHRRSKKLAEEILLKIAYHFEQKQSWSESLSFYALVQSPPSRERQVRILDRLGEKEKAHRCATDILENPKSPTEVTFATDYLNRTGLRISRSMTRKLKSAEMIEIPRPINQSVEKAVLSHLQEKGWKGLHSENFLWRGLFGLTFWAILFDTKQGTFHHPLQRQPSDLNDSSFFELRQEQLENRLSNIKSRKRWKEIIETTYAEKEGVANRFVTWHPNLLATLEVMIERLPVAGLKSVLLEFSKNNKEHSTGFPDLFIWKDSTYQFYEIKSPNDHLSAQQLFWIDFLCAAKIKASVLRVQYLND